MSEGRQLCLKWNDFQENVSKSFSVLRNCSDFQDVTLVSEDHQRLSAHRIILSTCSEYFRKVLRGNKEHKPILCLENVSFKDLESILDYVYHGETQVEQKYVQRFLKLAQRFKLEGLQETTVDDTPKDSKTNHEQPRTNNDNVSNKSQIKTMNRSENMPMGYTKPTSVHSNFHGELFPPLRSKGPKASMAWSYGGLKKDSDGILIKDRMYCALCPKFFVFHSSPGALLDHLRHHHIEVTYKQQTDDDLMLMEEKRKFAVRHTSAKTHKAPPSKHSEFYKEMFPPPIVKGPRQSMDLDLELTEEKEELSEEEIMEEENDIDYDFFGTRLSQKEDEVSG